MNSPGREGRPGHGWRLHHRVASAVGPLPRRALRAGAFFRRAFQYKRSFAKLRLKLEPLEALQWLGQDSAHVSTYMALVETQSRSLHCRMLRRMATSVCPVQRTLHTTPRMPRDADSPHWGSAGQHGPPIMGEDVRVSSPLPRAAPPQLRAGSGSRQGRGHLGLDGRPEGVSGPGGDSRCAHRQSAPSSSKTEPQACDTIRCFYFN